MQDDRLEFFRAFTLIKSLGKNVKTVIVVWEDQEKKYDGSEPEGQFLCPPWLVDNN